MNSERIVITNYGGYLYLQREDSTVHSQNQSEKYTNEIQCIFNLMNNIKTKPNLNSYYKMANDELLRVFYFYWYYFANVDSKQELSDWKKNVLILNKCHIISSKINILPKTFLFIIKLMRKYSVKLKFLAWRIRRGKDCGL